MVNESKSSTNTNNLIEDKTSLISRKVWDLSRNKTIIDINTDGSVPLGVRKMIRPNELILTNYIKEGKRTALTKIDGQIIQFELTEK